MARLGGQHSKLSPFELKDKLIEVASNSRDNLMLNAGRGNPNFLATIPRRAFFQLGLFSATESEFPFSYTNEGLGGFPHAEGLAARFDNFLMENRDKSGIVFLANLNEYQYSTIGASLRKFAEESYLEFQKIQK